MDILWAQLVENIQTDPVDESVVDYGMPVHILEYGGMPARIGETILLSKPIVLLCKWGRMDATTYGDIVYAASLTSPDYSTELLQTDVNGKDGVFRSVTLPPTQHEWFTIFEHKPDNL